MHEVSVTHFDYTNKLVPPKNVQTRTQEVSTTRILEVLKENRQCISKHLLICNCHFAKN
jgi:hypothetical protein